jgi:hypothetical protein
LVGDALRDALDPRMRGAKWNRAQEASSTLISLPMKNPSQLLRRVYFAYLSLF